MATNETTRKVRMGDGKNDALCGRAERLREHSGRFGKEEPRTEGRNETLDQPSRGGTVRAIAAVGTVLFAGACTNEIINVSEDAGVSACETTEVSTRCTVDTPTRKVCMVYEGNAVEMDGILFTAKDIAPEGRATDFDYEIRDELLECEPTGDEGTVHYGEEVVLAVGGQAYKMRAPAVVPGTTSSPGWAELDVEKVVDEPPAACPEEATRCEDDEFGRTCQVREGKAVLYDGYLWQVSNISLDHGTGKFKLTIMDPEADCGVVGVLSAIHEGETEVRVLAGGFNYVVDAKAVQAVYDPRWALVRLSREVSYCEAVDIPIECDVGTESGLDSIRCPLYTNMGAIKFGNILFAIERMYTGPDGNDRVDIRAYNSALSCRTEGGFTNGEYSVSPPLDIGLYRYQATVGAIDRESGVADVRITRELKMCGPTTDGILNVGESVATPRGYKVRLDDVTRDGNSGIFTLLDLYDREVASFVLARHESVLLSPAGIQVRANEVAGGLLLISKWADISVAECTSD